jgi:uncharacterized protein with HEPN domain
MTPRDRAILEAIAESARLAQGYVRQQGADWLNDSRTVDAVAKRVEQIGELAKHLSPTALAATPDVPWREVKATRTFLAHDYENVDLDILGEVVAGHLPVLHAAVALAFSKWSDTH